MELKPAYDAERQGLHSHAERGNDQLVCSILEFDVIKGLVDGQFAQHDDLRDAQRGLAVRGIQGGGEVDQHFAGRAEGFVGVGQQRFGVVPGIGQVHGFRLVGAGHDVGGGVEVEVEGAVGGFVEFLMSTEA